MLSPPMSMCMDDAVAPPCSCAWTPRSHAEKHVKPTHSSASPSKARWLPVARMRVVVRASSRRPRRCGDAASPAVRRARAAPPARSPPAGGCRTPHPARLASLIRVCTEGGGVVHADLVGATARSKGGGKGDGAAAADHAGSAAAAVSAGGADCMWVVARAEGLAVHKDRLGCPVGWGIVNTVL